MQLKTKTARKYGNCDALQLEAVRRRTSYLPLRRMGAGSAYTPHQQPRLLWNRAPNVKIKLVVAVLATPMRRPWKVCNQSTYLLQ